MKASIRAAAAALVLAGAGCMGLASPFRGAVENAPELRFANRSDLDLAGGPLPLDIVFTIHPDIRLDSLSVLPAAAAGGAPAMAFDGPGAFRELTRNVLAVAFRSAVETPPGLHARIEELRRSLPQEGKDPAGLPGLGAKALVLVDFRPPCGERADLTPQLYVAVHDISFGRYEEFSLFNPRLLVFEDFAEVVPPVDPSRLPGALLVAWKEVLGRMRASDRFRRYLALDLSPVSEATEDGAVLLGIVPAERAPRTADPKGHEWVERSFLFPRAQASEVEKPDEKVDAAARESIAPASPGAATAPEHDAARPSPESDKSEEPATPPVVPFEHQVPVPPTPIWADGADGNEAAGPGQGLSESAPPISPSGGMGSPPGGGGEGQGRP
jgi:hypothetical protein